jgi:hypothetical protein
MSTAESWTNKRRERRASLDIVTMPFLATRDADQQPFEYLLVDLSHSGAQFALPQWAANRERLEVGDVVNLHLPLSGEVGCFSKGKVVRAEWDEKAYAERCAVSLFGETAGRSPFGISTETADIVADMERVESLPRSLVKLVKDCYLLKKGVAVYLKHLTPYFSRIGGYAHKDYPLLKDVLLDDILRRVVANRDLLDNLHSDLAANCQSEEDIPKLLNLEELRSIVESEISPELFAATFESERITPYISAVKELEKKLYTNYNLLVMIYLLAL